MRLRMKPRGLRALLLLPTLTVGSVAAGAFTQLPAQAARPGQIEICKSSANGMTGQSFNFTYTDSAAVVRTVSVLGGGCSAAETVAGGLVTVVEAQGGTTVVQSIKTLPKARLVSSDLSSGTAIVKAPGGGTETVVTYANVVPGAEIKVCKQAATDSDAQLYGKPFSFSINGGSAFTVTAGHFGQANCSSLFNYAAGTNVTVRELQPAANVSVSEIDVLQPPSTNVVTNLSTRTVKLTVGSGVNIVTYTNQVDISAQKGWIEICKNGSDEFVLGNSFTFNITDAAGLTYGPYTVLTGQCTGAIQVTAGPATVSETAQAPFYLSNVTTAPSNNFISQNDTNGTASVNVVAGDQSTETAVFFNNDTEFGYIKVCKALDSANSNALAGTTFTFTWKVALSTGGTLSGTTYVVANTFANGPACVFINDGQGLPLGSIVTFTETSTTNVANLSGTQTVTVPGTWSADGNPGNNITSITFTNQAEGTIEICKDGNQDVVQNGKNPFSFVINGSIDITVNAGQCSNPIAVPAGTATVDELPSTNFHLVSVTATGPLLDNRLLSGTNPITVSVPFGGVGNETLVTYTNAANTGQFKICKTTVLSEPFIGSTTFNFTWYYTLDGAYFSGTVGLEPGQCSALSANIPVVDSSGSPVPVFVTEGYNTLTVETSETYQGNGTNFVANLNAGAYSSFDIGAGTNIVTYNNELSLLGGTQTS
jgi:hypothetical protein